VGRNQRRDSGPGTLRDHLTNAVRGDIITFNPSVFPPNNL